MLMMSMKIISSERLLSVSVSLARQFYMAISFFFFQINIKTTWFLSKKRNAGRYSLTMLITRLLLLWYLKSDRRNFPKSYFHWFSHYCRRHCYLQKKESIEKIYMEKKSFLFDFFRGRADEMRHLEFCWILVAFAREISSKKSNLQQKLISIFWFSMY